MRSQKGDMPFKNLKNDVRADRDLDIVRTFDDAEADQKQQQEIDNLTQQMQQRFAQYDAKIAQMGGRIRVDTASHFAFDKADLRDEDKPMLDDFAKIVSKHFPQAVVTVEGFADNAGGAA